MLHPPHWFEWGWVAGQSGNDMPVDVGELVAEEFVVDLPGLIDLRDNLGDQVHFFHQLNPLCRGQVKKLRRMPLKDYHRPAGKELIVMEIGLRQSEVGDEVISARPGARAGFASWIFHG